MSQRTPLTLSAIPATPRSPHPDGPTSAPALLHQKAPTSAIPRTKWTEGKSWRRTSEEKSQSLHCAAFFPFGLLLLMIFCSGTSMLAPSSPRREPMPTQDQFNFLFIGPGCFTGQKICSGSTQLGITLPRGRFSPSGIAGGCWQNSHYSHL